MKTFVVSLALFLSAACSMKHKHEFEAIDRLEAMVDELANSAESSSDKIASIMPDFTRRMRRLIGDESQEPLTGVPNQQEQYGVYLASIPGGLFTIRLIDDPDMELVLDLRNLELRGGSTTYRMIRDYSTQTQFDWWFEKQLAEGSSEFVRVSLEPSDANRRFEGIISFHY